MVVKQAVDSQAEFSGVYSTLFLADVLAILNCREGRGVGAGPADAVFLQCLYQGSLSEARRRLREMLLLF